MVAPKTFGTWVARMSLLRAPASVAATNKATYTEYTITALEALQNWYNEEEGLWNTTGWWNSANCLTVLGDFSALEADDTHWMDIEDKFAITFTQAQQSTQTARRSRIRGLSTLLVGTQHAKSPVFSNTTVSPRSPINSNSTLTNRGYSGFINDYYDDEGWWALAWIRAYDVTGKLEYLKMAESIFGDMQGGVNATCGGGIYWSKDRNYKNAIANELYFTVAASLANRASDEESYLSIAKSQWSWFKNSGLINDDNLINDGLTINANGTCTNNGETVWSYNQGVIIGGLIELYDATGNSDLLSEASIIATAAIDALSKDGILHDECEPDCGIDGSQFKGMFAV